MTGFLAWALPARSAKWPAIRTHADLIPLLAELRQANYAIRDLARELRKPEPNPQEISSLIEEARDSIDEVQAPLEQFRVIARRAELDNINQVAQRLAGTSQEIGAAAPAVLKTPANRPLTGAARTQNRKGESQ